MLNKILQAQVKPMALCATWLIIQAVISPSDMACQLSHDHSALNHEHRLEISMLVPDFTLRQLGGIWDQHGNFQPVHDE